MRRIFFSAVLVSFALAAGLSFAGDDIFGGVKTLRGNSPLQDDLPPSTVDYKGGEPGANKLLPRGFTGAPPQIPHSVENLNLSRDNNDCLMCHDPAYADEKTVAIPATHMQEGKVSMARYNCTQCHVPQADVKPLVKNMNDKFIVKSKGAQKK
ncbi:MAG: nitrate reductase cytochrome c-type subunit [Nitrospinae bacterium]|nr:nitrate reductase cytochrome c-type subunit [Nitrospinota bacterium]